MLDHNARGPSRSELTDFVENAAKRSSFAAAMVSDRAEAVADAAIVIARVLAAGGKILVFGNGGSAACAQHFAAEFTGKLYYDRIPLAAISLTTDTSAMTAIANDYGYLDVFSRQVRALGRPGDIAVGLSTSGTSANVQTAIAAARELGMHTLALTGKKDELGAEMSIQVGLGETARIQEAHDLVLHELAQLSERLVVEGMLDDASADRFPFVLPEESLVGFRDWARSSGQEIVTTNGVFDVLHEGHHGSLKQARLFGDRLVVLVNSDESVRKLKGQGRPIRLMADRLSDLRRSPFVDHVVVMADDRPSRLLALLEPQVHCKGADYVNVEVPEEAVVQQHGGRMEYLSLVDGYSTTALENKVRSH